LLPVALAGVQTPPPAELSELRAHLQDEQFGVVTSVRGLPLGVRDRLQALFASASLDIADPGAEFRATEASANPTLPSRRLVAAGCAVDQHCLIYYQRGGGTPTWRVMLFHWSPAQTRFEWGAIAPGGLATVEDVRKAVLSGAIKGETTVW
jgi:hypothetical protein